MTNPNRAFGKVLRELRTARKATQESLGYAAGLDRTYISMLELGQRNPTLVTMLALCGALQISFTELAVKIEAGLAADRQ
ncbi:MULTISPECIES: helix-turn-helix domain-containing protein [Burkholderia]|jgi:transcriptional regulator with XRE-family HTH domain|uniref:helix-turn-helix domain-containing protein n=1 Tax=Burkholderia TaxID=32008 RepID=UPI0007530E7D|nr:MULTISPECIES: helix-turn-helix transcriptional regulator [Burkholderia cepacia complex]KWO88624.1 XRE family transcriptional regulator [Burkholderia ubonensis]MBR8049223.1 helix-turn-helix transcriptional regulator [Burkholderia multivorans]MBY4672252.1 helix-turn-helix domain-containing protein [Burkholderia multivorans]UXZ65276.1 helix-turn-helix domain-containing protein [Burkholderia multivorans]HDR8911417.1 helix-turn-helix transcriptional regulator [Burkholderia multivorans]